MRLAIWAMIGAAVCGGQTTVNGGRDYKGTVKASGTSSSVDFSGAGSTAPMKTGTLAGRPQACTLGQVYFATDATAGQNLSFCTSTGNPGTWTAMSGGGGGSTGAGVSYCAPASASGSNYSCSPNPAVTSYAAGVTVAVVPDVNGAGGATTLNVNGLGTRPVKLADGSTNPGSADLTAGRLYFVTYDGILFRLGRGVQSKPATSHQFLTAINADGSVTAGQPAASDVTGLAASATTDATNAANVTSGTVADARLSSNVPLKDGTNVMTGYVDLSAASWRPPEVTVANLPAAASVTGRVYVVTDATSAGNCAPGGGSARTLCRSTGSGYEALGGGSGGGGTVTSSGVSYCAPGSASGTTYACSPSPALAAYTPGTGIAFVPDVNGSGGSTTLNVNGLGARPVKLADGSANPSPIELQAGKLVYLTYDGTNFRLPMTDNCVTGTISMSSILTANAMTQEITILPAGLPGDFLPSNAWVNITTPGVFSSTLAVSMGRTGSSTNAEWIPALDAKQAQAWGDKPTAAVFGVANIYPALVINFTGGAALGNGSTSNVSAGVAAWGFCGKRSLQ